MIRNRRILSTIAVVALSFLSVGIAWLGGAMFDSERIVGYWTSAYVPVDGQGGAAIVESIDYDFGVSSRRGIFRVIPDLAPDAEFTASSATAPTPVNRGYGTSTRVRIGDPNQTIRGRYRYLLNYELETLNTPDGISWNAVGTEWEVSISNVEIHLLSDVELLNPQCDTGRRSSFGGCEAEQIAPGHLRILIGRLDTAEGVTISATAGNPLAAPAQVPAPPPEIALSPGLNGWLTALVALLGTLAAIPFVQRVVRRRGREQILQTTAHALGFIDDVTPLETIRLADQAEMARLVYPSLNPPSGITAAQGGILMKESVSSDHKVAWLIEAASLGEVDIEQLDKNEVVLRRGSVQPRPTSVRTIDEIFKRGDSVVLKKYDSKFALAWTELGEDLEDWQQRSGFWDEAGHRNRALSIVLGVLVGIAAMAAIAIFSGMAMRWTFLFLPFVAIAGGFFGASLATVFNSWELLVRTPEGTSKWLEVEALRRFLSELEPESALNMIEPDRFAGYTPWAMTFGLEDKWGDIIKVLEKDPRFQGVPHHHFAMGHMSSSLSHATATTSTAPSSSGGGGGGGGVGGGGGGGGGGSW